MRLVAVAVCLLVVATVVAGCGGKATSSVVVTATRPALAADKGAITGLVIDDRYRPVADATILLTPLGLIATSDAEGQFAFSDLAPAAYVLIANAKDHEAAPKNVDVAPGQYTEVELEARRTFSDLGAIITTQYSVFIPCAFDYVVNGYIIGCIPDSSGDTYRPGFTTDSHQYGKNATYLVSEAKLNQVGDYDFQVREDNGSPSGGERYAVGALRNGDYIKMVNQRGIANTVDNLQNNNHPWNNTKKYATLVFLSGQERSTFEEVSKTTCNPTVDDLNRGAGSPVRTCNWRGVGAKFGIKARFVQSLFIGEPATPIAGYHTLG
ncbi:MAG: carboxypeptidase-like regulatory domain-containing protein [bacterium]